MGAEGLELLVSAPGLVAEKLKDHRLKPGGVNCFIESSCSYEIEGPPAKAWWCQLLY